MQYNNLEDSGETPLQGKNINPSGSVTIENNLAQLNQEDADAKRKKYIKWGIIGAVILIVVTLAIVLPLTLGGGGGDNPVDPHPPLPAGLMNPYNAVPGSAKYAGSGNQFSGSLQSIDVDKLTQAAAHDVIPKEFLQYLKEQDTQKQIGVDWRNLNFFAANNMLQQKLDFLFDTVAPSISRMVVTTSGKDRFSVPLGMVPQQVGNPSMRLEMMGLSFFDPAKDQFGFKMVDVKNPKNVLLNTIGQSFLFADKFIQMDFQLPTQQVYGFGDRVHEFLLKEGAFTMWSSGQDAKYDDARGRGGLSGVHPFLLVQTATPGIFIGLYFRNANAMTPVLRFSQTDSTSILSFITIGGQIELYIVG